MEITYIRFFIKQFKRQKVFNFLISMKKNSNLFMPQIFDMYISVGFDLNLISI